MYAFTLNCTATIIHFVNINTSLKKHCAICKYTHVQ